MLAVLLLIPIGNVLASSNSVFSEDGYPKSKNNRPAINEDFKPDYSCLFDVTQEKCIPGSAQECPKPYFGSNEDDLCFAKTLINGTYEWECPKGYYIIDDDESGQCYSIDSGECEHSAEVTYADYDDQFSYILLEDEGLCANPAYLCNDRAELQACKDYSEWKRTNSDSDSD